MIWLLFFTFLAVSISVSISVSVSRPITIVLTLNWKFSPRKAELGFRSACDRIDAVVETPIGDASSEGVIDEQGVEGVSDSFLSTAFIRWSSLSLGDEKEKSSKRGDHDRAQHSQSCRNQE